MTLGFLLLGFKALACYAQRSKQAFDFKALLNRLVRRSEASKVWHSQSPKGDCAFQALKTRLVAPKGPKDFTQPVCLRRAASRVVRTRRALAPCTRRGGCGTGKYRVNTPPIYQVHRSPQLRLKLFL